MSAESADLLPHSQLARGCPLNSARQHTGSLVWWNLLLHCHGLCCLNQCQTLRGSPLHGHPKACGAHTYTLIGIAIVVMRSCVDLGS